MARQSRKSYLPLTDGGYAYPQDYVADVHWEPANAEARDSADFNGMRITPEFFNSSDLDYQLTLEFHELVGAEDAEDICVVVTARNARGNYGRQVTWNCDN